MLWHDIECGGYVEDLPLWRELAADARTARSSTSAPARAASRSTSPRRGHEVVALDRDAELLAALRGRAPATCAVETVVADARDVRARPRASR